MLNRTIVIESNAVHPGQADLDAAVAEFKRQAVADGKTLDGEPEVTLLSHHVGQSMTFNVKAKTVAAPEPAKTEPKKAQGGNS